jgi:hypothetical protein
MPGNSVLWSWFLYVYSLHKTSRTRSETHLKIVQVHVTVTSLSYHIVYQGSCTNVSTQRGGRRWYIIVYESGRRLSLSLNRRFYYATTERVLKRKRKKKKSRFCRYHHRISVLQSVAACAIYYDTTLVEISI